VALRRPLRRTVLTHIHGSGHRISIYRSREVVGKARTFDPLRTPEMYLIRRHSAGEIAGNIFTVMRANDVPAVLFENYRMIRHTALEFNARFPLACDRRGLS
jgi:hypothetical protein